MTCPNCSLDVVEEENGVMACPRGCIMAVDNLWIRIGPVQLIHAYKTDSNHR